MKIEPDDPLLTAYALCELDDVSFAAVEKALADSPQAQQEVAEILQLRAVLTQELATEPRPALDSTQRAMIESAAALTATAPVISWTRVAWLGGLAAAACLAVGLVLPALWNREVIENENAIASHRALDARRPSPPTQPAESELAQTPAVAQAPAPPLPADSGIASLPPGDSAMDLYRMDPRLLQRYGLRPRRPALLEASRQQAPAGTPLASGGAGRYGMPRGQLRPLAPSNSEGIPETGSAAQTYYRYSPSSGLPDRLRPGNGIVTGQSTASYPLYQENVFRMVADEPLSTFSLDVDTASYAHIRRFLNQGQLPPPEAVRIEELVNYFTYSYPQPANDDPFAISIEAAECPWNREHRLVRIGLQARTLPAEQRPPANLVFLIDVSGSMSPDDRLPLIRQALRSLTKRMRLTDRIGIVVYAAQSQVALPSTSCEEKEIILAAIDSLNAGGSTNGGQGIQQAYAMAKAHFVRGGVNRVILCTDGDFNVGITDHAQLTQLVQTEARAGVFLTALGVGDDNYQDALMQRIADQGNGNYHYLDTLEEAQKVLLEQMNANLVTVAKDVKAQVEFNPAQVSSYRLIGYEKRLLHAQDFNNDAKDAGEVGPGHTVTALYEIVPVSGPAPGSRAGLRYQTTPNLALTPAAESGELFTVKLRYKRLNRNDSELREWTFNDRGARLAEASPDCRFAAAIASFGMLLQGSGQRGQTSFDQVLALAQQSRGTDESGARAEFINLVQRAKELTARYPR